MAFTPRPLAVPNMRTDYSAENSAFANLGQTLGNLPGDIRKEQLQQQKQQLLGQIGSGALDYEKGGRALIALGDTTAGAALLGMGQKQQQLGSITSTLQSWGGSGGGQASVAPIGTANDVENGFVGGIQKAGLTNPIGLGAVAAYGKAESGYSPANVNRTWNDPSESGQAGQAGGIMSWRADRLQNLQRFAAGRGEQGNGSPETQAAFLAQEDPDLIPRLNAAKTPQEANQIMANAWRFAGYDREGGENARRGNLTAQYAQRYGSQGAPAQTAARPVQVAENEADVQRLEAQQGNPIARSPAPAQVAQAAPDAPAPGSSEAQGYFVPPSSNEFQQRSILNDPKVKLWNDRLNSPAVVQNEGLRVVAQRNLDLAVKDAEQRFNDGKAPESVREWQWAVKQGLTDAKSPVAYAKEKADATRADTAPVTRQIKQADGSEVVVQWNPDNRKWEPLAAPEGGEAVKPKGQKLTEGQSKDLIFHNRGLQALETFETVSDAYASGKDRLAAQVPGGNYIVPESFQKAQQSGRNFLASILRKDSGAAITKPEEDQYGAIFLPQPGDKPGTLAQKKEARAQAIDAIRNGLGTAEVLALGQRLTTRNPGEAAPERPAPAPVAPPAAPAPQAPPQRPAGSGAVIISNPKTGQRMMLTPNNTWEPFDG